MPRFSDHDLREGQRRLRQWLPAARAKAKALFEEGSTSGWKSTSGLGESVEAHLHVSCLHALVITPAPKGGWHADLILKHLPPGIPDILGTPVQAPCRSKAEAAEAGMRILTMACLGSMKNATRPLDAPTPPPVFLLHGLQFTLVPELLTSIESVGGKIYTDLQTGIARLHAFLQENLPDVTVETVKALPDGKRAMLLTILHGLSLGGMSRYPEPKDVGVTDDDQHLSIQEYFDRRFPDMNFDAPPEHQSAPAAAEQDGTAQPPRRPMLRFMLRDHSIMVDPAVVERMRNDIQDGTAPLLTRAQVRSSLDAVLDDLPIVNKDTLASFPRGSFFVFILAAAALAHGLDAYPEGDGTPSPRPS